MKSAEFAEERMQILGIPEERIEKCKVQILATSLRRRSDDRDTNYLLDADLSILGRSGEEYAKYAGEIRKEYSFYPDILYKPGRKKVINHFLGPDRIYKTNHFYDKYEIKARKNLEWELNSIK
jgi:predicted metal-dependent HD superfamily phosphohydrolase